MGGIELEELVREVGALYLEKRTVERENAELRGRLDALLSHESTKHPECGLHGEHTHGHPE